MDNITFLVELNNMKRKTKHNKVSELKMYDCEDNPNPPDIPADRIEKVPGISCSIMLIIIIIGIVIGFMLTVTTN